MDLATNNVQAIPTGQPVKDMEVIKNETGQAKWLALYYYVSDFGKQLLGQIAFFPLSSGQNGELVLGPKKVLKAYVPTQNRSAYAQPKGFILPKFPQQPPLFATLLLYLPLLAVKVITLQGELRQRMAQSSSADKTTE